MKTILLLMLLIATPTLARLGETMAQCEARYGKPIADAFRTAPDDVVFFKAPYELHVHFHEGVADRVTYWKVGDRDPLIVKTSDPLATDEIKGILDIYGNTWNQTIKTAFVSEWKDDKMRRRAYYTDATGLIVETKAATARSEAADKAEREKGLKGL